MLFVHFQFGDLLREKSMESTTQKNLRDSQNCEDLLRSQASSRAVPAREGKSVDSFDFTEIRFLGTSVERCALDLWFIMNNYYLVE